MNGIPFDGLHTVDDERLFAMFSAALMAAQCVEPDIGSIMLHVLDDRGQRMGDLEENVLELYHLIRLSPPSAIHAFLSSVVYEMQRRGMPVPHAEKSIVRLPTIPSRPVTH